MFWNYGRCQRQRLFGRVKRACRLSGLARSSVTNPKTWKLTFANRDPGKRQRQTATGTREMNRHEKAGFRLTHGSGSNEKVLTGKLKRLFLVDYTANGALKQCHYCGSDYMRFSVNGYCQRCQQLAEYVIRSRKATAERGTYR